MKLWLPNEIMHNQELEIHSVLQYLFEIGLRMFLCKIRYFIVDLNIRLYIIIDIP